MASPVQAARTPPTPHPRVPRFQRGVSTPGTGTGPGEVVTTQPDMRFADAIAQFTIAEQLQDFMLKDVRPNRRPLGSGAYGSVEELEVNGVLCAGKTVHDIFLDPINQGVGSMLQKFVQECRIMSRLRHPHVVQFLGLWQKTPYDPLPVLVMEYLPITLDTLLGQYPDIPITMKVSFLHDVSKGLTYLHECDPPVIHRDLTARNVLLNNAMVAKIADFGGSRIVNLSPEELSRMTQAPGNICYMPPEASGTNIVYTKKLDIFSFGVLALFTVTQQFPGNLHPATYADDSGRPIGRSEVERRDKYFEHAAEVLSDERRPEHRLLKLMQMCMQFEVNRPTVLVLLQELEAMRRELEESDDYARMHKLDMILRLRELEDQLRVVEQQRAEIPRQREEGGIGSSSSQILELRAEIEYKDMLIARLERSDDQIIQLEATLHRKESMLQELDEANVQLQREAQELEERLRYAESTPAISEDNQLLLTRVQELERSLGLVQQQQDSKIEKLEAAESRLERTSGELRVKEDEIVALRMEIEQLKRLPPPPDAEAGTAEVEFLKAEVRRLKQQPFASIKQPSGLRVHLPISWNDRCPPALFGMRSAQVLVIGHKVFVGGGDVMGDDGKRVLLYDTEQKQWQCMGYYSFKHFAIAFFKKQVVLVGGYDEVKDEYSSVVSAWDRSRSYWKEINSTMPTPRGDATAVGYKQWLIVAGGFDGRNALDTVEMYDSGTQTWSMVDPLPAGCLSIQSALHQYKGGCDTWYLLGRASGLGDNRLAFCTSLASLTQSHCGARVWRELPKPPLSCSGVVSIHGYLLAVGGKDRQSQRKSTIHIFLHGTGEWLQVADLPSPRHSCMCAGLSSGKFLVIGGKDENERSTRMDMASVTFMYS